MTTTRTTLRRPSLRRFVRHYLEIVVAAVAGMVVLGPAESMLLNPIGWAELLAHPETSTLVMATNMTVAMAAWMRLRRHGWAAIGEMAVAMYAPVHGAVPAAVAGRALSHRADGPRPRADAVHDRRRDVAPPRRVHLKRTA
jgi:hypothetical protein